MLLMTQPGIHKEYQLPELFHRLNVFDIFEEIQYIDCELFNSFVAFLTLGRLKNQDIWYPKWRWQMFANVVLLSQ